MIARVMGGGNHHLVFSKGTRIWVVVNVKTLKVISLHTDWWDAHHTATKLNRSAA